MNWVVWIEQMRAQIWHSKAGWTVQVWYAPGKCVQPTKVSLLEALEAANKALIAKEQQGEKIEV